jgi:hypothetical protein
MAEAFKCDNCGELFEGSPYEMEFERYLKTYDDTVYFDLQTAVHFSGHQTRHEVNKYAPALCKNCFISLLKDFIDKVTKE